MLLHCNKIFPLLLTVHLKHVPVAEATRAAARAHRSCTGNWRGIVRARSTATVPARVRACVLVHPPFSGVFLFISGMW